MNRSILLFSLSVFVCLGIGFLCFSKGITVQAGDEQNPPHPFKILNQKAKDARTGDLAAAKELVGETISLSGYENELRGSTGDMIEDRVGKAEIRYQESQTEGISEARVAQTINGLVKKLNLPKYAKTSIYEVRKLRLSLLPTFPQFINQKTQSMQPIQKGAKFDSQMSPAEAVFVTQMMMQQKLSNDEYQVTDAERLKDWKETHNHHPNHIKSQNQAKDRSREMREALDKGVNSMSMMDTMQISTLILNTLGIEK